MKPINRRSVIFAAPALILAGRTWATSAVTPGSSEGPFYPVAIPDDHDNDLVRVESAVTEAGGEILQLNGLVNDANTRPVPGAVVEIWQCDANGVYLHPRDRRFSTRDAAFQGFGRTRTNADGRFAFRTIVPVPYPGRTPHIHVKVYQGPRPVLTTQLYRRGHPENAGDFLFRRLTREEQNRVSMDIRPDVSSQGRARFETDVQLIVSAQG